MGSQYSRSNDRYSRGGDDRYSRGGDDRYSRGGKYSRYGTQRKNPEPSKEGQGRKVAPLKTLLRKDPSPQPVPSQTNVHDSWEDADDIVTPTPPLNINKLSVGSKKEPKPKESKPKPKPKESKPKPKPKESKPKPKESNPKPKESK